MTTAGDRLREERARLGLSQPAFAALGGVRKNAQIKYESGERQPDSTYLSAIAANGVDVGYVLTGQTAALQDRLDAVQKASKASSSLCLPADEQLLVQEVYFGATVRDSEYVQRAINDFLEGRIAAMRQPATPPGAAKKTARKK